MSFSGGITTRCLTSRSWRWNTAIWPALRFRTAQQRRRLEHDSQTEPPRAGRMLSSRKRSSRSGSGGTLRCGAAGGSEDAPGIRAEAAGGALPIATTIEAFESQRDEYYARVEAEIVQLSLAIAAKILHREAQVDPMLVAALVRIAWKRCAKGPASQFV